MSLSTILLEVFGAGGRIPVPFRRQVERLLSAQVSAHVAESFGRALTKVIDGIVAAPGVAYEARLAVAKRVAQGMATALAGIAQRLVEYPEIAGEVVRLDALGQADAADAARGEREEAQRGIRRALQEITRLG